MEMITVNILVRIKQDINVQLFKDQDLVCVQQKLTAALHITTE